MSPRDWKFRLEDIAEALDRIFEYVQEMDYENWLKDRKTIDAVVRNLEIIGEAAAEVKIYRQGNRVILEPIADTWDSLFESLNEFPDDFLKEGRTQPAMQDREDI